MGFGALAVVTGRKAAFERLEADIHAGLRSGHPDVSARDIVARRVNRRALGR